MERKHWLFEQTKIVTAEEMIRVEKMALAQGCSELCFMEQAGKKIAQLLLRMLSEDSSLERVLLLVGKGNQGGDAYVAGIDLLQRNIPVKALCLFANTQCSSLNQQFQKEFIKAGGELVEKAVLEEPGWLLVDGLLGTGFRDPLQEPFCEIIQKANASGHPICSIDLPSGVHPSTGEVSACAIRAQETLSLGMAKTGLFLQQGWEYAGILSVGDFGLPNEWVENASASAFLPNLQELKLPPMQRTRHKYEAGYVIGMGGCPTFAGAMQLAGLAALRTGAGIVRIFQKEPFPLLQEELIGSAWEEVSWDQELQRARAVFVGPGMGRTPETYQWLKTYLASVQLPCVLDADALWPDMTLPKQAVLTPHRGEAKRLLGVSSGEEALFKKTQDFCEQKECVCVLKGAPTFVFSARTPPTVIPFGDPGMATAGAGDVLTGVIAALLGQGVEMRQAAVLGACLHAFAGEIASKEKSSYGVIAGDLIECLPRAVQLLET